MIEPEDRLKVNDLVIVLLSKFDPPNLCYSEAVKALSGKQDVSEVWLCPLPSARSKQQSLDICNIMSMSLSSKGTRSAVCSLALERDLDAVEAVRFVTGSVPYLKLKMASFEEEGFSIDDSIVLSTKNIHDLSKEVVVIKGNLKAKEKLDFDPMVLSYLKKHGID